MERKFDVIVIGSGHNGLVNACYLQKAGLNVLVLDKNDWIGGLRLVANSILEFYIQTVPMFAVFLDLKS